MRGLLLLQPATLLGTHGSLDSHATHHFILLHIAVRYPYRFTRACDMTMQNVKKKFGNSPFSYTGEHTKLKLQNSNIWNIFKVKYNQITVLIRTKMIRGEIF